MRIFLGIMPDVETALKLTESLIAVGCAAHGIYLLLACDSPHVAGLSNHALLVPIGEHRDTCYCCVRDPRCYPGRVFDRALQQQRYIQLIDRFARHYPGDWQFHQNLVKGGNPVGVVHLEEPRHDEVSVARTVLAHSITRLQISDLPEYPSAE